MTARMMTDLEYFPNIKVANRRLNRLSRKRTSKVRKMNTLAYLDNSWQCVYTCGPPFGSNMVQHHTEVTALLLMMEVDHYERWAVPCDADALLTIGELRFLWENHRGTQNDKGMAKRVEKLTEWQDTILWVCKDKTDVKEVIRQTKAIAPRCLYTTFDQAMADPHAAVWQFADGLLTDLPQAGEPVDAACG
jgi:hypothetical protein